METNIFASIEEECQKLRQKEYQKERQEMAEKLNTKLDALTNDIYFDQLVDLASEVCLSAPLPPLEPLPQLTERQRLFENMGPQSLRAALELQMGIEHWYEDDISDAEQEAADDAGLTYIKADTPMRKPEMFYDKASYYAMKRAEQFGKAIIDEAFQVLGQDAYHNVELMKSGEQDKQLRATAWLYKRINALHTPPATAADEDNMTMYHPIRLSPKAIGRYPNTKLEPTCLAASVLAASFFEKAEVPYVHAGVMTTAYQEQLQQAVYALRLVRSQLEEHGDWSQFVYRADMVERMMTERLNKDRGYHVAIYCQLADGRWMQFDPFFSIRSYLPEFANGRIDEAYGALSEFHTDVPGIELSVRSPLLTVEGALTGALFDKKINKLSDDRVQRIYDIMRGDYDAMGQDAYAEESVLQKIYEQEVVPMLHEISPNDGWRIFVFVDGKAPTLHDTSSSDGSSDDFRRIIDILNSDEVVGWAGRYPVEDAFYKAFSGYVLWDQPVGDVAARMQRDPAYKERRLADISNLAYMMITALTIDSVESAFLDDGYIATAELGMPHARVGFSVLSDFAAFCDDALQPSFWLSNWSSLVPITETMGNTRNEIQYRHLGNIAVWSQHKTLTYTKSRVIIDKFIDDYEREKLLKEGKNSHEQEDSAGDSG